MISNEQIQQQLEATETVQHVEVTGDGYHYQLLIVSDAFQGKTTVARQQWVYATLKEYITDGRLHAISMKTLTAEEWEKQRG